MKKICKVRRCFADEIQVLQDQIWNRSNHFEFIEKSILGPNASARNLVKGKNTRQEKNEQWRTSAKDLTAIYICFTGFISSWLVYSSSITVLSALGEISTVNFWLAKISRGCVCSCMTILLNHHASRTDQVRSRGSHRRIPRNPLPRPCTFNNPNGSSPDLGNQWLSVQIEQEWTSSRKKNRLQSQIKQ